MSRAIGLVKFPNNHIYIACYDGTSDFMYSPLITTDELQTKYDDSVFDWNDCAMDNYSAAKAALIAAENDNSAEDVEIYSDYGGGFWWNGKASEKHMCITEGNWFWDIVDYQDGHPEWAQKFMNEWLNLPQAGCDLIPPDHVLTANPIREEDIDAAMVYIKSKFYESIN